MRRASIATRFATTVGRQEQAPFKAMGRYSGMISTRCSIPAKSAAFRVYRRAEWAWAVAGDQNVHDPRPRLAARGGDSRSQFSVTGGDIVVNWQRVEFALKV